MAAPPPTAGDALLSGGGAYEEPESARLGGGGAAAGGGADTDGGGGKTVEGEPAADAYGLAELVCHGLTRGGATLRTTGIAGIIGGSYAVYVCVVGRTKGAGGGFLGCCWAAA